jgi:DNA-binding GntR family transcriptional regulator
MPATPFGGRFWTGYSRPAHRWSSGASRRRWGSVAAPYARPCTDSSRRVVTTPYKVTQVAEVGPRRIQEITALREVLEPLAVRQALSRLRQHGLAELKRLLGEMHSAGARGERDNLIELHLAFHRSYYALAHNDLLLQIWTLMEGQTRLYLHTHRLPLEALTDYAEDHQELLEAFETGSVEEIDTAVVQHVERVRGRITP